ncbi:tetratricopeptide repeat protein [Massilia suwonensis]|uniref:Tetratricopeptide repeat protein n=1 Tax=Massilia suwonensis TaxID=648895 RepID=A0ABW0MJC9_9BURK
MRALLLALALASAAQAAEPVRNAQAAYQQALGYRNGTGVAPDAAQAARLMEQAARAGLPQAMFTLSNMLAAGEGVPRDEAAARRWLEQAAEAGHPAALQELALREPDPRKAELLMRQAEHALQHQ